MDGATKYRLVEDSSLVYHNLVEETRTHSFDNGSQLRLIVILSDGALRFAKSGKLAIEANNYNFQNEFLQRAQKMVLELMECIGLKDCGEIAKNLKVIYRFVLEKLINANMYDRADFVE